eukprot:TRINITY_DN14873_c0_g1_i1.p1 TRINITY_DN14873_c0_g1~~TRINITY_DN14873_c0_g1_i1.p1  ORF type:complete len:246 (+),score=66.45 TRINITY_DN14873_c0_g1_i1:185-922(+)
MTKHFEDVGEFTVSEGEGGVNGTAYLCHHIPPMNSYFKHAQDHLPMAYAIVKDFATQKEVEAIGSFFRNKEHPAIKKTEFNGDDIEDEETDTSGQPEVFQLYSNPEPFKERFPQVFDRLLALKDSFGVKVGVGKEELSDVTFPQDIRHLTYRETEACPWHRDDPSNHFNTIIMCSRPGVDFGGGQLQFYPPDDPTDVILEMGDAVIYSTPKIDHAVTKITSGIRSIFLVELKRNAVLRAEKESAQ